MAGLEVHQRGFIVDLVCIIFFGVAVLLLHLLGNPFERGFNCDDGSIRYPLVDNTIPKTVMAVLGIGLPILVFTISEIVMRCLGPREDRPDSSTMTVFGLELSSRVSSWVRTVFIFLFGAVVQQMLVDIGKLTVGRLRPHFLAACQPDVDCETTYQQDLLKYIDDYECTAYDTPIIREARQSFPSGHSSLALYSATYTIMYLECTFILEGSRLILQSIQVQLMITAWYVALSRVADNMNHWSDVFAGMSIGFFTALLMVLFLSDFYRSQWNVDAIDLTPLRGSMANRRISAESDRNNDNV